jgi:hypothetical protein
MFPIGNMKIDSILVTQRKLKRKETFYHFLSKIMTNDYFPPIQLVQLEDGRVYCNDGTHRLAAYFRAGRTELHPLEYDLLFSDKNRPTFGNIKNLLSYISLA